MSRDENRVLLEIESIICGALMMLSELVLEETITDEDSTDQEAWSRFWCQQQQ